MDLLKQIKNYAFDNPTQLAICSEDDCITYKELEEYSNKLAGYIINNCSDDYTPIIVYGHKSAYMQVCFLACAKAGRAYCPIDTSLPVKRIEQIIEAVNPPIIFSLVSFPIDAQNVLNRQGINEAIKNTSGDLPADSSLGADDTFYIIFTSGSTGNPKGVEITRENLNCYLRWSATLGNTIQEKAGQVFLNQAPFSFDLSVMDMYTCLACGGTLFCLSADTQMDFAELAKALEKSNAGIWVSTPSFVEMCMTLPEFKEDLLNELQLFLFCGETLSTQTAKKLQSRFPKAKIINTYGPTESTVAISDVTITSDLMNEPILPVGKPKPGTIIEIHREDGTLAEDGEIGEIIILGDTVAKGYYQQKEITDKAFFTVERQGKMLRGYRTGDAGYLQEGMIYYSNRIDLQIKLNGYRIELGDIEKNILKLPKIRQTAVLPVVRKGKIKYLAAFVASDEKHENEAEEGLTIKKKLHELLPHYMIPKKIIFLNNFPMNNNGKIDRKMLEGMDF